MHLHISPNDGRPIYRQIVDQVKYLIVAGRLNPHDELPPVRTLARLLLINPNTVVRAYHDLEEAGLIYKRQGAGTYVAAGSSPYSESEQIRRLTEQVDSLLVDARHMNCSFEELQVLMQERNKLLEQTRGKS